MSPSHHGLASCRREPPLISLAGILGASNIHGNSICFLCSLFSPGIKGMSDHISAPEQVQLKPVPLVTPRKVGSLDIQLFPSPRRNWGLGFSICSMLNQDWRDGDCQPKALSLFSLFSRQLGFSRSCQHSDIGRSEASTLGCPKKGCGIVGSCGCLLCAEPEVRGYGIYQPKLLYSFLI